MKELPIGDDGSSSTSATPSELLGRAALDETKEAADERVVECARRERALLTAVEADARRRGARSCASPPRSEKGERK